MFRNIFFKILILAAIITSLGSCSKSKVNERVYDVIWKTYLKVQFEESFDEKQSIEQRRKSLQKITEEQYRIDFNDFMNYLKLHHPEKYKNFKK